jgi:16S rRNA C967 or C1407 C5-methylase (RsmB/RsmF family)/NOL1/NOP2/fmu family ribosome biogenesis protein
MYPGKFTERLRQQKYLDSDQLEEALDRPSPVSIRVNPEKRNLIPVNSDPVVWTEYGFYLSMRPSFTLDPLFHSGCYYPQEASGMFLEQVYKQVVNNPENIRVLDLCGAPGGKSTHLSTLIGDKGLLVANEVIKARAGILAENITKWGCSNTIVTNNDPESFSDLKEYFDLILVDAPCSGEGMFSDRAVRNEWSPENAALCSERQKRIVSDVWPSLKGNGILIYCTCTFNPAENEEIIEWIADQNKALSVRLDISAFGGIREINYNGITGYGFYPGKIKGEGLFISVVKKPGNPSETKRLRLRKDDNKLTNNDSKMAGKLIDGPLINLYRNDDIVYDLSISVEEYQFLKNHLRIIKGGAALFKSRKDDFTPLHDLALYCKIRDDAFPMVELEYSQAISFLKKDNLTLNDAERGWILLTYKGVNLGFAKNIGSRINNYFPMEGRIRMDTPVNSERTLIEWISHSIIKAK